MIYLSANVRKLLIVAAAVIVAAAGTGCGSTDDNSSILITAQQTAQAQPQAEEIDKNDFYVLPEEAQTALDVAAERAASLYGTQHRHSFGYTGKAEINGSECYCFSVFNNNDEFFSHIADLAVTFDGKKVFVSEADKNDYRVSKESEKASN